MTGAVSVSPSIAPSSTNSIGPAFLLAWAIAVIATLGALFVGEIMGQAPCNLCWYQRIAMFPLALLLGLAAYRDDVGAKIYALPLAVIGGAIAGFHSLFYAGLVPETIEPCGAGPSCSSADMTILGGLPLPFLSLAAFVTIAVLLLLSRRTSSA